MDEILELLRNMNQEQREKSSHEFMDDFRKKAPSFLPKLQELSNTPKRLMKLMRFFQVASILLSKGRLKMPLLMCVKVAGLITKGCMLCNNIIEKCGTVNRQKLLDAIQKNPESFVSIPFFENGDDVDDLIQMYDEWVKKNKNKENN